MNTWIVVALILVTVALVYAAVRIQMLHADLKPLLDSRLAGTLARL